jgi:hypothetical protein
MVVVAPDGVTVTVYCPGWYNMLTEKVPVIEVLL